MLFYFEFRTYAKLLRLAFREKNPRNRWRLLRTLLFVIPAVNVVHAICFALDPILFPGLRRVQVRKPVFVIGHARSGTTLLHRLMCEDRERFSAFLFYELYLPSLLEKKLVRLVAEWDRRHFGGALERRVKAWEDRKFGPTRDIHYQSLTIPEEDDVVLWWSCASGFWIVALPYMGELDFYYVDRRPERQRRRLMRFYKECIRRQLYLNGPEKHHLSKNPTYNGRVEALIETFPDACIVVPYRNPYETIPSLLKLLKTSWKMRKWTDAEMQRSLHLLAEQSYDTYLYPLEVLERHPETPRAIVDYAELVEKPKAAVERVYADLGFPLSPEIERALEAEQRKAGKHETSHRYSLEEFGLKSDEIHARLADLFERFHWDEADPRPTAVREV
jgi:hypothetical protein